jgi:hypothetical protein
VPKIAGRKEYATYLAYFGLVLALLTLINMFASDIYPGYRECERIMEPLYSLLEAGEGVTGEQMVTQQPALGAETMSALMMRCNNLQNDVFISYVLISVGIAFFVGSLITMREAKR